MECSGTIREAFRSRGHDAWSCDFKPDAQGSPFHIEGDVFGTLAASVFWKQWDLAIFHPDCTYLSSSGYHWCYRDPADFPNTVCGAERLAKVKRAQVDFMRCVDAGKKFGIPRVCVENPRGIMNTRYRRPDQEFQPNMFGDDASKLTGLWLENLPPLFPTRRVAGRQVVWEGKIVERWANQTDSGQNKLGPSPTRAADRAITYPGPAAAMADQWGTL